MTIALAANRAGYRATAGARVPNHDMLQHNFAQSKQSEHGLSSLSAVANSGGQPIPTGARPGGPGLLRRVGAERGADIEPP